MAQVFSCKFCEISKNIFFTEQVWTAASKAPKLTSNYKGILLSEFFTFYVIM